MHSSPTSVGTKPHRYIPLRSQRPGRVVACHFSPKLCSPGMQWWGEGGQGSDSVCDENEGPKSPIVCLSAPSISPTRTRPRGALRGRQEVRIENQRRARRRFWTHSWFPQLLFRGHAMAPGCCRSFLVVIWSTLVIRSPRPRQMNAPDE